MVEEWLGGLREGTATVRDGQVIESDDLAVLTGHVTYAGVLEDGEDVEVECRITLVLEKVGNTWTIVHEHTSVPIDMEDMEDEELEPVSDEDGEAIFDADSDDEPRVWWVVGSHLWRFFCISTYGSSAVVTMM